MESLTDISQILSGGGGRGAQKVSVGDCPELVSGHRQLHKTERAHENVKLQHLSLESTHGMQQVAHGNPERVLSKAGWFGFLALTWEFEPKPRAAPWLESIEREAPDI